MAKTSKLGSKLKCMLRRWHSSSSSRTTAGVGPEPASAWPAPQSDELAVPSGYRPVYVGKSRRRYVVSERLLDRPVFRNLLEPSSSPAAAVVGCEVVLFEHLLWMLDSADPNPDSLDDLVELYACCSPAVS